MNLTYLLVVLSISTRTILVISTPEDPTLTFEALYNYGKIEYTTQNWLDCVGFFRRAIEDFTYYQSDLLSCRQKCNKLKSASSINSVNSGDPSKSIDNGDASKQFNSGDASNYENSVKKDFGDEISRNYNTAQVALCLLHCREDRFTERRPPLKNYQIYQEFIDRKPFHYIQLCYFKMNYLENAVKNSYTYLTAHPKDEEALDNVRYYMEQKGFKQEWLVDLWQKDYEKYYISAVEAYSTKNYQKCATDFKQASTAFLSQVNKCRSSCEDSLDWSSLEGDNPEMSVVMTSIISSVKRCQHKCPHRLSKVNGKVLENLLALIYEHLHVCHFNSKQSIEAMQSIETALLLDPTNIVSRRNKFFYMKHYERPEMFEIVPEIAEFYVREQLEARYLEFVNERFRYEDKMLVPENIMDKQPLDTEIYLGDNFDYSLLDTQLISLQECSALETSALLPNSINYGRALADELIDRINFIYGQRPTLKALGCAKEKIYSGCKRRGFVVALESERCGAILTDPFDGCAVVFCLE